MVAKPAGNVRRERRGDAVRLSRADAEGDQREHVRLRLRTDRQPASKNGHPAQNTTGLGQEELKPHGIGVNRSAGLQRLPGMHARPCRATRRQGAAQADPEPAASCRPARDWGRFVSGIYGSRAMPHFGQEPGMVPRTSGASGKCKWRPARPDWPRL